MTRFVVQPAEGPLRGTATVPGDKSIGHRALLLSGLATGRSAISGLSGGADNRRTRDAMARLGATIEDTGDGAVVVEGTGTAGLSAPTDPIDCGNSGTSMRLLCGVLAGQGFDTVLIGDESLSRRPMRRIIDPLAAMGAVIEGREEGGNVFAPLTVRGGSQLRGIDYASPIASAQVKSAVLLAGLWADGVTRVREPRPSRDHTERMLIAAGAPLSIAGDGAIELSPQGWDRQLAAVDIAVPADPSAAAFLVVAALVAGAERVTVPDVCINPTRVGFLDAIAAMGGRVEKQAMRSAGGEPLADLCVTTGAADSLGGGEVSGDMTVSAIDEIPILAVVAARADGVTHFRDAAELRVKESDRIASTCAMLRALGVAVDEQADGFSVEGTAGAPLSACTIDAAGDHRIAMAGVVAGLCADGEVVVEDVDNVDTSFPGFADVIRGIGAAVERR